MTEPITQIIILLTGGIAIWLVNDPREGWQRHACLFGLAGQPFWIYSTVSTQQWGMFVLTLFYTLAWFKGFRNHWRK